MPKDRKTQGITAPTYVLTKKSGKEKEVKEGRGRRLMERAAKRNIVDRNVSDFDINQTYSLGNNRGITRIAGEINNGSKVIEAGEPGGYSTEPAQHYDISDSDVSQPIEEMGNVDIEDIHTIANEPPITTSQNLIDDKDLNIGKEETTVSPAIQGMGEGWKQVGETKWTPLSK